MEDELVIQTEAAVKEDFFSNRYFVSLNADKYVDGMQVAVTQAEADSFDSQGLIELAKDKFEAIGQDCQLIDGDVVKGPPMVVTLNTEARQAILAVRLREASEKVQTLQDAVDLDMATEEEKTSLTAWKKYRVLLSRVDAIAQAPEEWPQQPE